MSRRMTAFVPAATFMLSLTIGFAQQPDQIAALRGMDGLHLTEYLKENFAHDWILPAGKAHIVLAVPGSAEFDKSYVEPDGSVSPGVGSYGLTTWLYDISDHRLYAPEEMEDDRLSFQLEDGHIPIAHSSWNAGTLHFEKRIAVVPKNPESLESNVYVEVKIGDRGEKAADFLLYVAVRSLGPAGGPIKAISAIDNGRTVLLNGTPAIQFDPAPTSFGATSFNSGGDDISRWAKRGSLPLDQSISSDSVGLASGAAVYHLHIDPKRSTSIYARLAVRNADRHESLTGELSSSDALRQFNAVAEWWKRTLEKVDINANEPFGRDTYYASIAYILMNTVGDQLRVTNVSYPVTYLRDGVFMLNAIDQAGLHDRAKRYLDYFVKHPWSGAESQEGPEGDAPGELCWIIGEHFRLTRDIGWLRSVYPTLLQEADLILFLENPIDGETREIGGVKLVAHGTSVYATMNTTLKTIPLHFDVELSRSYEGVILGRLDTGLYAGTTTVFAVAGLKAASEAATALADFSHAAAYELAYLKLRQAINRWMKDHPEEFSFHAGVWPTEAFDPSYTFISNLEKEDSYAHVAANSYHEIEDLGQIHDFYTYFGAAHSLLRLGNSDVMYSNFVWPFQRSPFSRATLDAHAVGEYTRDEKWFVVRHWPELWANVRGWSDLADCIPHGWTSAEIASLIRDMLFYEQNGALVLSAGKRLQDLSVGQQIGVTNAPSEFGDLTYSLRRKSDDRYVLTSSGVIKPPGGIVLDLGGRLKVKSVISDGRELSPVPVRFVPIKAEAKRTEIEIIRDQNDSSPLVITSGPAVTGSRNGSAMISWATNIPSSSRVAYGTGKPYHSVISDYRSTTSHSVILNNLVPGKEYSLQVSSMDERWQQTSSSDVIFTAE